MQRAPNEPDLFAVLMRRHARDVHQFVWRRTRDDMLADDITAATFETCWTQLPRFRPRRDTIRPWLFRIAANEVASHFRSEGRRSAREQLAVSREQSVSTGAQLNEGDDPHVLEALGRLGERHQVVLSLRFLTDLSTADTACALGVTRSHCAVLQHRALAALRRELEGEER